MSRYKAYSEYRDSGVEWFDSVPTHWDVKRISYISQLRSGDAIVSEKIEAEGDYPVYGGNGLRGYASNFNLDGEFILIGRQGALCGNINYGSGRFWASEHAVVVYPSLDVNIKWLGETLRAMNLNQYNVSAAQPGLAVANITCLKIPFPQRKEQDLIAAFLDHETAKIDALIEKQQRLIELLKEKRQAVISHAVTKGLNPNAPMKDSGVEWLGEVPAHWDVVPMKFVCEVKDGTHDTPQYVDKSDNAFPLITSKDFSGGAICFDGAKYISKEDHSEILKRSNTEDGDVLMSMIGGNIGKALVVNAEQSFSIKNVALFKTCRDEHLANLVVFYLQSGLLDIQISLVSRGGAQDFLSLGDLRSLVFFKIPEKELSNIVKYIRKKISVFDVTIEAAEEMIGIMQERRTALISAAVTGKIDVRDWQVAA